MVNTNYNKMVFNQKIILIAQFALFTITFSATTYYLNKYCEDLSEDLSEDLNKDIEKEVINELQSRNHFYSGNLVPKNLIIPNHG